MKRQSILLIIILLAFGGAVYFFYQQYFAARPTTKRITEAKIDFKIHLAELKRLKDLRPDVSVFEDPFFKGLQTPPPPVEIPVTQGRVNPFSPF